MPPDLTGLAQFGALGFIVAWFLYQLNPRIERIERAVDLLSRTILLDIVSRPGVPDANREQARAMYDQVEARRKSRTKEVDA